MTKADLHVHSRYSNHPSEWFLQRLGAAESYTDPETVYQLARQRGMDLVTITDHNRIDASLELARKYPRHCFSGVEATCYFPEDGCKIHILIYGLDIEQFKVIQNLRRDIYQLRDYLRDQDLPHSVAHATYVINHRLSLKHFEKLILLFNRFEGINGSRNALHNVNLARILEGLGPEQIEELRQKHAIEPWGPTPWRKSLTGGSDDHAGFFIGKTYTEAQATTPLEFLEELRQGRTAPGGRQNDFRGLTFAIYKIAYDFSQAKGSSFAHSTFSDLSRYLFSDKKLSLFDRLRLNKLKSRTDNEIYQRIFQLIEVTRTLEPHDIDSRLELLYDGISDISDQYFKTLLEPMTDNIDDLNILRVIQGLSSMIPGLFLSVPFFSTFRHLYGDRRLIKDIDRSLGRHLTPRNKRILWISDTLTDLNGVSVTLQTIGHLAEEKGYDIRLMGCLGQDQSRANLPPSTLLVEAIHSFKLPHYEQLQINIPSILQTLKMVHEIDPDEVYISTPGPLGLLGLMIARMLGTKATGIYHTDFTTESESIVSEPAISNMIEGYSKWFFNQFDNLLVPTEGYMQILRERGYRHRHMTLFQRGLRSEHFKPQRSPNRSYSLQNQRLLYVGRISKDKNLEFLIQVFRQTLRRHPHARLTLVGDGPYLPELKQLCTGIPNIEFAGRCDYAELPALYNAHDLFLFPSVTDTFGMAVLEAQACGLPALVSNIGGPQEIIRDQQTGFVLPAERIEPWLRQLDILLRDLTGGGEAYAALSQAARQRVKDRFDWNRILYKLVLPDPAETTPAGQKRPKQPFGRMLRLASNLMVGETK